MICEICNQPIPTDFKRCCGEICKHEGEDGFVQVKKEDLEFIFSQLGKLDEYQNYEKQKEFKSKYLGEKGN